MTRVILCVIILMTALASSSVCGERTECSYGEDLLIRYLIMKASNDYSETVYFERIGATQWLASLATAYHFRAAVVKSLHKSQDIGVVPVMIASIKDTLFESDNQTYFDDRVISNRAFIISTAISKLKELLAISEPADTDFLKHFVRDHGMVVGESRIQLDAFVELAKARYSSAPKESAECKSGVFNAITSCELIRELGKCPPSVVVDRCGEDKNVGELTRLLDSFSAGLHSEPSTDAQEVILRGMVLRGAWKWALAGLEFTRLKDYRFITVISDTTAIPYVLKSIITSLESYRYDQAQFDNPRLYALFALLEKLTGADLLDEKNIFSHTVSYFNGGLERESLAILRFVAGVQAAHEHPACAEYLPFETVLEYEKRYDCGVMVKELSDSLLTAQYHIGSDKFAQKEERIIQGQIIKQIERSIDEDLITEDKILSDEDVYGRLTMDAQLRIIAFKRAIASRVESIQDKNPQCEEYRNEKKP